MIEVEFVRSDNTTVVTVGMPAVPSPEEEVTFNGIVYIVVSREWAIQPGFYDETGNYGGSTGAKATATVNLRGKYKRAKNKTTGEMVEVKRVDMGLRFRWPVKDSDQTLSVTKFLEIYDVVGVVE